jgi:peptidoglycan/LPS O-acetylase OafA/YrhL
MHLPGHENTHFLIKLIFFVLMMPNVINAMGAGLAYGTQTWFIGAEEQFYLIWPWLLKFFKNKLLLVIAIIVGYLLLRILFNSILILSLLIYIAFGIYFLSTT